MATLAQSVETLKLLSSYVETLEEAQPSEEEYAKAIEELVPKLDSSVSDFKGAIDRRIALMESIPHLIKIAEDQIAHFQKRIKASSRILDYLKSSTKELMELNPDLDFSGTHKKFSLQNAGGVQAIKYNIHISSIPNVIDPVDAQKIPEEFIKKVQVFILDKQEFDAAIRSGKVESEVAELQPRSKFVRIK